MKMRTIPQLSAYIRETDPESSLTQTAIRRLVRSGELPSVSVGVKRLVALETLDNFLRSSTPAAVPPAPSGAIRRID